MWIYLVHDRCFTMQTWVEVVIAFLLVLVCLTIIVWGNICYYRDRRKMTPEERRAEDEIAKVENQVW